MRKKLTVNLDENPFAYFKIRSILLGLIICCLVVSVSFTFIMLFTGQELNTLDNLDPIFEIILGILFLLLWMVFIVRKLTIYKLDWHRFIGRIPINYDWLSLGLLGIMNYAFAIGAFRIIYYPVSIFFPSWLQSIYTDATLLKSQGYFFPELYQLLFYLCPIFAIPVFTLVLFVILYRLSTKYGNKKAIFFVCLFYSLSSYTNIIFTITYILIIILLYLRTRTLLIPAIYILLINILASIWRFINQQMYVAENSDFVTRFQSQLGLGIILTVISAPYLIYWLKKNWFRKNEQLPYFES